jgi:hypothetical protein
MATAKAARPHYFPAGLIGGFGEPDTGSDRQRVASSLIRPRSAGGIGAVLVLFRRRPGSARSVLPTRGAAGACREARNSSGTLRP